MEILTMKLVASEMKERELADRITSMAQQLEQQQKELELQQDQITSQSANPGKEPDMKIVANEDENGTTTASSSQQSLPQTTTTTTTTAAAAAAVTATSSSKNSKPETSVNEDPQQKLVQPDKISAGINKRYLPP